MNATVFLTVISGVLTYVLGQLVLKLVIEPVHDLRKTIGLISHALIERANVIQNPGVPSDEVMNATSQELRRLSSQLQSHLYLVPKYTITARVFQLPSRQSLLDASGAMIGLSNSVYRASGNVYEVNAKRVEKICDSLSIYMDEASRWPKELK
jgi:hypothetical protein